MTHPSPSLPKSSRRRWWIAPSVLVLGLYAGFFAFAVAQACTITTVVGQLDCVAKNTDGTYTAFFGFNNSYGGTSSESVGYWNEIVSVPANPSTTPYKSIDAINFPPKPQLSVVPISFASGQHDYAFAVNFSATQNPNGIAWQEGRNSKGQPYEQFAPISNTCAPAIHEITTTPTINVGQTANFVATVTLHRPSTPQSNAHTAPGLTGKVLFTDENNHTLGTAVSLTPSGQEQINTTTLLAGTHTITATYSDSFYASVSDHVNILVLSSVKNFVACVDKTNTGSYLAYFGYQNDNLVAVTIPVGSDNSFSPSPQGRGQTTTFQPGNVQKAFSVSFNGSNLVWYLQGDTTTASSAYTPCTGTTPPSTQTSVVSSLNPSVYGQNVTFTATVIGIPPGGNTPSGPVTFKDGPTTLGTGTLDSHAQATYTTGALTVGSHPITAVYGGDTVYTGSTSPILTQVVNKIPTATAVISSVNPSVVGQSVTFTATVTAVPPAGDTPPTGLTGSVTFKIDGVVPTTNGTVTLSGNQATYTTSVLSLGSHNITAIYSGDVNYIDSQGSMTQTVGAVPPPPAGGNNSYIRISQSANLTANPAVDVAIDGQTSFPGLKACTVNPYAPLTPGSHTVSVSVNGSQLKSQSITFSAGDYYTVAFVDDASASPTVAPNLVVFQDDLSVTPGQAKVRVYHLNDSAGPISVSSNGTVEVSSLSFESASSYFAQNPGVENYTITLLNHPATQSIISITEAANQIYGIFVMNNCTTPTSSPGIPTALPQTGFAPVIPGTDWNAIAFLMGALAIIGAGFGGVSGLAVVQYRRRHR